MSKRPIIITLVAVAMMGVLGVGLFILASSSSHVTPPSVSFIGYTNDIADSRRALFVVTNRASQTLHGLMPMYSGVEGGDSTRVASSLPTKRIASEEAIRVWMFRPS